MLTLTFWANLALGGITALTSAIIALSGAPASGNAIIPGWLIFDNSNNTNTEYVGVQSVVQHLTSGYNWTTNGTASGANTQVDGLSRDYRMKGFALTATGGTNGIGGYYNSLVIRAPYSTTGSLVAMRLECGGTAIAYALSGGLINVNNLNLRTTGTTLFRVIPNFNTTKAAGTGSQIVYGSGGSLSWGPQEAFVLQDSTAIRNGTTENCKAFPVVLDRNGI